MSSSNITLYAHRGGGPNPPKVSILLEKLGLDYDVEGLIFGPEKNGVKHPDFLKINPNGRVPAIVDHKNSGFAVWESGACLIYLAEKYDAEGKFYGKTPEDKAVVAQWLTYQLSGLGPVQGNVNFAIHYWKPSYGEDAPASVLKRFTDETHRLYAVLEEQLAKQAARGSHWIALDRPTIADFSYYPWVNSAGFGKIDLAAYPHVQKWLATLQADKDVVAAYAKIPPA